jgi:hypothetical protein
MAVAQGNRNGQSIAVRYLVGLVSLDVAVRLVR